MVCQAYVDAATTGRPSPATVDLLRRSSPTTVADRITAPTLIVQGEQDTLFGLDQADATARQIAVGAAPRPGWSGSPAGTTGPSRARWSTPRCTPGSTITSPAGDPIQGPASGTRWTAGSGPAPARGPGAPCRRRPTRAWPAATRSGAIRSRCAAAPQQVLNPPGGSPAAITSIPGASGTLGSNTPGGSRRSPRSCPASRRRSPPTRSTRSCCWPDPRSCGCRSPAYLVSRAVRRRCCSASCTSSARTAGARCSAGLSRRSGCRCRPTGVRPRSPSRCPGWWRRSRRATGWRWRSAPPTRATRARASPRSGGSMSPARSPSPASLASPARRTPCRPGRRSASPPSSRSRCWPRSPDGCCAAAASAAGQRLRTTKSTPTRW